jgi:prepilin-type N-terminal cleavage/methylation domain-containing protein
MRDKRGFTLIELIVVIVIIGILALIGVQRFMGMRDKEKIKAAEAEVQKMKDAVGLFEIDYGTYNLDKVRGVTYTTNDYFSGFVAKLKDPEGRPYKDLPDTTNFSNFSYTGNDTTFTITVIAKDTRGTKIHGTPEKIYWH